MILPERILELHVAIMQVPEEWRYRWCAPPKGSEGNFACACMGAANCSGRLGASFTQEEWAEWVAQNPPRIEGVEQFININGRYDKEAHDAYVWKGQMMRMQEALKPFTNSED